MNRFWDIYWRPADAFTPEEREALHGSFKTRTPIGSDGSIRRVTSNYERSDDRSHPVEWFEIEILRSQ